HVLRGMRLGRLQMCLILARISRHGAALASAAMPPLLVHRASTESVEELGVGGLPLGSALPARYSERTAALSPGDTLLFASDGFAELVDAFGNQMGFAGATRTFREAARGSSAQEVVERLGAAVTAFRGTRPQDDDVTFLVIRVT